jgi:hypothetical protein
MEADHWGLREVKSPCESSHGDVVALALILTRGVEATIAADVAPAAAALVVVAARLFVPGLVTAMMVTALVDAALLVSIASIDLFLLPEHTAEDRTEGTPHDRTTPTVVAIEDGTTDGARGTADSSAVVAALSGAAGESQTDENCQNEFTHYTPRDGKGLE